MVSYKGTNDCKVLSMLRVSSQGDPGKLTDLQSAKLLAFTREEARCFVSTGGHQLHQAGALSRVGMPCYPCKTITYFRHYFSSDSYSYFAMSAGVL